MSDRFNARVNSIAQRLTELIDEAIDLRDTCEDYVDNVGNNAKIQNEINCLDEAAANMGEALEHLNDLTKK